jgi:hypothetical protein
MEVSLQTVVTVSSLLGGLVTSFLTIVYWIVKMRKDIDAAHVAIRQMRKNKGVV